jgi:hypothetical protein
MLLQKIVYHTDRLPLPVHRFTANGEPGVNRVPAS